MSYINFKNLTTEQLNYLKDTTKTIDEIQEHIGCGAATVTRWRKKIGVRLSRGSKPKKPRPWQNKKINTSCCQCGIKFDVVPSRLKLYNYCSRKCVFANEVYRSKLKQVDKSYMQTDQYRLTKIKLSTPEYRKYRNRVATLTKHTYEQNKHIINPNNYKRTIAGIEGGYHLDHIMSCREGFEKNIMPEQIATVENLQMLPWRDNVMKGRK